MRTALVVPAGGRGEAVTNGTETTMRRKQGGKNSSLEAIAGAGAGAGDPEKGWSWAGGNRWNVREGPGGVIEEQGEVGEEERPDVLPKKKRKKKKRPKGSTSGDDRTGMTSEETGQMTAGTGQGEGQGRQVDLSWSKLFTPPPPLPTETMGSGSGTLTLSKGAK
ncbi:unnamed protein product, partial [Discosporangium mesarthrocarpum]